MHEDFRPARVVDRFQCIDNRRKVEITSAGHLQQFLFLGQLFHAIFVLRDAAKLDVVFVKEFRELCLAHRVQLFALIAVWPRPDVDCRRSRSGDFEDDFLQPGIVDFNWSAILKSVHNRMSS